MTPRNELLRELRGMTRLRLAGRFQMITQTRLPARIKTRDIISALLGFEAPDQEDTRRVLALPPTHHVRVRWEAYQASKTA